MQCTIVDVAAGGDCKFCDYCEVRIIPITVTVTPHYAVCITACVMHECLLVNA